MNSALADRIRESIGDDPNVGEIKMFGGICFTLNGNMLIGTMKDGSLLVRVGEAAHADAMAQPGASPMNFTGREMKGYVLVAEDALDDDALRRWIAAATAFVGTMPPKAKKPARSPGKAPVR